MATLANAIVMFAAILVQDIPGGRITGTVAERETGSPIAGATVRLRPGIVGTSTKADGKFVLENIPAGEYVLDISHIGYRGNEHTRIVVGPNSDTIISIILDEAPIMASQVVVTASRREQSLQDVPVTIATISADALANRVSTTVDDALRTVAGVTMIDDQINVRGSSGYSRGVGSRVLLLVDGSPFLTGDTGEINWESLPVDRVDRVEVIKGAGSAMYGSSAMGGVVNVITKRIENSWTTRFRTFGGVYEGPPHADWKWSPRPRYSSGAYLSTSGKLGDHGYLFGMSRLMDEGYRQNDIEHRYAIMAKSELNLGGLRSLHITGNLVRRLNGNFFWWKSLHEPLRPPDNHQTRRVESTRGYMSAVYRSVIGTGTLITVRGQYYGNDWSDEELGRINNSSRSDVVFGEVQFAQDVGAGHQVIAGISSSAARVRSNIFGDHPGIGVAAFVQDDMALSSATTVSAGLRFDWERVSALSPGSQIDPKLGITYKASTSTTLRGSLGTGFRYPSIAELFTSVSTGFGGANVVPNPDLRAERSISMEVGVAQLVGPHAWMDASVFHSEYQDLIEAGVDPVPPIAIRFDNVHKARISGFEISVGAEWFDRVVTTTLGYTLMDPRNVTTNSLLRFRPRHILVSGVQANVDEWDGGIDYRYIARIGAIDEQLVTLANIIDGDSRVPIHVMDIRVFRTLVDAGIPARIGLTVKNALNYQYVELIGNMAPPRTYILSIDAAFE